MGAAPKVDVSEMLSELDDLPSLPPIVYELSKVINDPMSSTKEVERIMSMDLAMTTKVLKLANSAYYAIPGGVSTLGRAVAYLGFDTIHQLVLSTSILKALPTKATAFFNPKLFWQHCIGVGIAAETLAKESGHPLPIELFTAGLVHDLGKVAMFSTRPEMVEVIIQHAQTNALSYYEAEVELGLPTHPEIGKVLAEKWVLPQPIQAVIRYHHDAAPEHREPLSPDTHKNLNLVHLANLLIVSLGFGNGGHSKKLPASKAVLDHLGITPDSLIKKSVKDIKINLDKAQEFIRIIET